MKSTSAQASESVAAAPSRADEMDVGLLRRGDGMRPIVGLGGSAGAIAALHEFFAAMPVDSGMAFVVVLHLSQHHESTLAQMFQRATAMPVAVAAHGVTVEPNCVYVIPPGMFLGSVGETLRLTKADEPLGKRVAVDYFFRTLAETHGAQSLAVVLSGAGADGALGLKRIKELGGLTIAQDPNEAEHPDMPRSAIATGVVDWVLGVKEMPGKLVDYLKQRGTLKLPGEDGPHPSETVELSPDRHEAALRDVLAFLHTRTGRDFSYYKRATILRRVARRMQVNGLTDVANYLVYLRTHAGEAGALLQDLLISVTNFFRDPDAFVALECAIPGLFEGKGPGDTVRVWVAGCATGEEAYSIAMLLCEHAATLEGPPQLQVFATDLDEDVIREARAGLYPATIAADVSEERLRRFFIPEQAGYRVRRAVRELVLFAPHDLLKDSPFSRLDLVSCRNLLIYLKREAQNRAFEIFNFALRPAGLLFLGTSEAVDEGSPLFAVVDKKQRLYTQRPGPQRLIALPAGPGTLARALALMERTLERPTVPGRVTVDTVQGTLEKAVPFDSGLAPGELHYRLIERFSPPSILVNSVHDIIHLSESAGRFLQFTGGEPTRNLLRTIHPMLRIELRAALYAAAQTHTVSTVLRIPVEMGDTRSLVDIRVTPAGDLAPNFLLVVFEVHPADGSTALALSKNADADQAALHLERELVATKAQLRDTIEQSEASTEELKASNEELQAINEELRSATEELETSREELQSINEELTTVNEELKSSVDQLARSNNDLQNLMAATDIATVFLDRDLRIQRFTPSAKALFNLIATDIGRPLSDLSREIDYPDIVADAERSMAQLQPGQREVSAGEQWYLARTLPYRTADGHIVGVVLTFLNITERKRAEQKIARLSEDSERQRRVYETVLTNTPDFVYVFSLDHRVLYANDSLIAMWGRGQDGAIGKTFLEIGYEPWHAQMHDREIDQVRATRQPIRGEVPFTGTHGRRQYEYIFVPVIGTDGEVQAVAGTTRDVTDRKDAEEQLRTSKERQSFLVALTDTLRPLAEPIEVQAEASRVLGEWLGANRVVYFEIRGDEYVIERDYTAGVQPLAGRYPVASFGSALLTLLLNGRTVIEADATAEPDRPPFERAAFAAIDCRAHVDVPLVKDGRFVAGMTVHISDRRDWTAHEVALIEETAERTWAAVERVRAVAALRASEERRRLALDAAELGAFNIDPTTNALASDERYRIIFAGSDAAMDYEQAFAAIHPDDQERVRQAVAAATRAHDPAPYAEEYRVVHPDGSVRWVFAKGRANYDREETGRLVSFDGTVADVTSRKQAEAALQDSEERLAFVRRSSGVGFWYCNLPFDVLQWDELVKAHFHLPPDAVVTIQTFYDRIHPDDREPTRQAIERSIADRTPYNVDYRTLNPDTNAVKWVRAIGRTFYAADGTPTRFDGVTLDVSDQKQAEANLRESEQRFRLVADAAPVLIWLSDTDQLCCWFNRPWLDFTGRSMAQEVGNGWAEGIHPDDIDRCLQTHSAAFKARVPFSIEYRLRRYDGEFRWMIDNGVPRYRAGGEFDGYIGSCLDVTDYKNAEAELREADRRKDEFLATLAHELRNPLAPIRSGLQVIRLVGAEGAIEQARSMMERQLLQMTRLVDDLLDVSRLTTGKLTLRNERLALGDVIAAALETSRSVIEQHGHDLSVAAPDAPIFVIGDPIRLAQVVSNLLTNAAKYTHRGGHIRVSVTRDDAIAVLAVADDGVGIPPHMLQSVFGMFTQVDRTLERTGGGLGVGLSLVKGLVEMHGGTVEARSDGEGRGSEFILRLPIAGPRVATAELGDTEPSRIESRAPRRILVVDDNVDAANMLGQFLKMMGHEVLVAYDGAAGITAAKEFLPSVVLCDIGMPKVNGYDTARSIRAEEWGKNAVLVALTGWSQEEDLRRSAAAGFDHHLVKPVEGDALQALLAGLGP